MNKKKIFTTFLKVSISLVGILLILSIFRDKLDDVLDIVSSSNKVILSVGVLCYISANIFCAYRYQSVLKMQRISLRLFQTWKLNYFGYFFNVFMPSSIGGDIGKAYYTYKYSNKKAESFTSVLIDRIIGLFSVCFLCVVSLPFVYKRLHDPIIPTIVILFTFFVIATSVIFVSKRVARWLNSLSFPFLPHKFEVLIKDVYILIHECQNHPVFALKAFFSSLFFQCCSISAIYLLGVSLSINLSVTTYFLLIPLVYIFSMLPSINGLGVREGALIYFFQFFIPAEKAFALSLLFDIAIYSCSFIGLFLYLFHKTISLKEIHPEEFVIVSDNSGEEG